MSIPSEWPDRAPALNPSFDGRVGAAWYLIQAKPREDGRALDNLINQQYQVFYPQLKLEKLQRGKKVVVSEPLFPGYIFIRLDQVQDNWAPIRSTRGVSRIVRFGVEFTKVPDAVVNALIEREQSELAQPIAMFQPGQTLDVVEGPFKGLEAVFAETKGEMRVIVLLDFLQKQHAVALPVGAVRAKA